MPNEPFLLTVAEAAHLLRLHPNSVYELVNRGELPHVRLGRAIRLPRHRLLQWMENQCGGDGGSPTPMPLRH